MLTEEEEKAIQFKLNSDKVEFDFASKSKDEIKDILRVVIGFLKEFRSVCVKVEFKNGVISGEQIKELTGALKEHPIKHLSFKNTGVADDQLNYFIDLIRSNREVGTLDLSNNLSITGAGAEYFAELLESNRSLLGLDLSFTKIGGGGAIRLARSLHSNSVLSALILDGVSGEGAVAEFIEALRVNSTLWRLGINSLKFGDGDKQNLCEVLKHNSSLCFLAAHGIEDFDHDVFRHLACNRLCRDVEGKVSELCKESYLKQIRSVNKCSGTEFYRKLTEKVPNIGLFINTLSAAIDGVVPEASVTGNGLLSCSDSRKRRPMSPIVPSN